MISAAQQSEQASEQASKQASASKLKPASKQPASKQRSAASKQQSKQQRSKASEQAKQEAPLHLNGGAGGLGALPGGGCWREGGGPGRPGQGRAATWGVVSVPY